MASSAGRYDESAKFYAESLPVLRSAARTEADASVGLAEILINLGYVYSRAARFKEAHEAYLEAFSVSLALLRTDPYRFGTPTDYALRALRSLRNYPIPQGDAESVLREAVAAFRQLTDIYRGRYQPKLALTLALLGNLYAGTGRQEEAGRAYEEALAIQRRVAEGASEPSVQFDLAMILMDRANLDRRRGNRPKAEQDLLEALAICRGLVLADYFDPESVARRQLAAVLSTLGDLYSSMRQFEKSEQLLKEALTLKRAWATSRSESDRTSLASTLFNIGAMYHAARRADEGERAYLEALSIWRALNQVSPGSYHERLVVTLDSLATLYRSQMRFDESKSLLEEALPIVRRLWLEDTAYGDHLASVLNGLAQLLQESDAPFACQMAQEASTVAKNEGLKNSALKLLANCSETPNELGVPAPQDQP